MSDYWEEDGYYSLKYEEKCWGSTCCVEQSSHYSRHQLRLVEGGYCSFHYHNQRANHFLVLIGKVRVISCIGWQCEATTLTPGEPLVIPSRVLHQFQVLESGRMIEEYWPDGGRVLKDDITRLTIGGMVPVRKLNDHSGLFDANGNEIVILPRLLGF